MKLDKEGHTWEGLFVTFRAMHLNFSSWPFLILQIRTGGVPGSPVLGVNYK